MDKRIIVAVDKSDYAQAVNLAAMLDPELCRLKVGKELYTATGPAVVEAFMRRGFDVFLDLKLHDIPNTVAETCKVIASMGVWMTNVHALGGRKMMEAAAGAAAQFQNRPKLIAVTILTSMGAADLYEIGLGNECDVSAATEVLSLANLARESGMDGVVCSGREAAMLRLKMGLEFDLVTPGIRAADAPPDDQARTMTAREAIEAGSSYLVIGRPITKAADPIAALQDFNQQISSSFAGLN